jgi:hypothetical protein
MAFPLIPLVTAAAGAAIPFVANKLGVGKNKERARSFADAPSYDPTRFQYGNTPGGADEAAGRYRGLGEAAQGRQGEQVDYGQANIDRGLAMGARDLSLASRDDERAMAGLMAQRAQGLVPSIAQMQADRQMNQAQAAQMAAASSARGAGGMALAQQNAANNVANMQGSISGQAQINAAQERLAAEQAAMGAYGQVRSGDMNMRNQDMTSQGMSAQMAQYQAQLNAAQRAQNDSFQMGMTGHERGVREAALNAGTQQQGMMAGSHNAMTGLNVGVGQKNADREYDYYKQAVGSLSGGTDAATASSLPNVPPAGGAPKIPPPKAAGGPVSSQQPYLVGERGPELVVPANDGMVIPAHQTRQILQRESGGLMQGFADPLPLSEPPGQRLGQSLDGHGFYSAEAGDDTPLAGGGLAAMSVRGRPPPPPIVARAPVSQRTANAPERKMSEAELRRAAALLEAQMYGDHRSRMSAGPAVQARSMGGPMAGLFGGGHSAGSGPAMASMDQLNPDASMNVLGSLRAHSDYATRFNSDPTGGMAGGGLF